MNANWLSAVSVLGAGLGSGLAFSFVLAKDDRRSKNRASADPRLDLVAQRDAAMAKLREIQGGVAIATAEERNVIELEAARAMRELEEPHVKASKKGNGSAAPQPVAESQPSKPGVLAQPWVWALGSSLFTLAIVLGLQSFTSPRTAGREMTGGDSAQRMTPPMAGAPDDHDAPGKFGPEITAIEQRVKMDPENIPLRVQLAEAYADAPSGAFLAFQESKNVLDRQPNNTHAMVVQAFVRGMMGSHAQAYEMSDRAVTLDPTLINGWLVRGHEAVAMGNRAEAEKSIAKLQALEPSAADQIRAELNMPPQAAAPAAPALAETAPAAANSDDVISGTIGIDPSLKGSVPEGAVVFVYLKDGSGNPMPVAARKFPAQFPISFSLGRGDAVMGRPIPASVTLEARLDADGNAFTKDPSDPSAKMEQLGLGRSGLQLTLKRPAQ